MATVIMNSDSSVSCEVKSDGSFFVSSNHTNKKNSYRLTQNIKKITSINKTKDGQVVCLNGVPYATIKNSGDVVYHQSLTSFETRLFAQGEKMDALPFQRFARHPGAVYPLLPRWKSCAGCAHGMHRQKRRLRNLRR